MKRIMLSILSVILLLTLANQGIAASGVDLYIDGQKVRTGPDQTAMGTFGQTPGYYMDAQPEIKRGRVFVPIRATSFYFGADVDWQSPNVKLSLDNTTLTLTIGSRTVMKNGSEMKLEAAPYVKNGRTMVPLRFISEAFGCNVDYRGGEVHIRTAPLSLDGKKVVSVQSFYRMTMGGKRSECKTNVCISRIYQFIMRNRGNEVAAPEYFGEMMNLDIGNYYREGFEISFMGSEGLEGAIIRQFKLYRNLTENPPNEPPWNAGSGTHLGEMLIRDVTNDRWYQIAEDNLFDRLDEVYSIGSWVVLFNNIV